MEYQKFNTEKKKWKVVNFSRNRLSKTALKQLNLTENDVIDMPAELKRGEDAEEYVHKLVSKLKWGDNYLVVPPGLVLLAIIVGRALAELQFPVQVLNLVRSKETGDFYIENIY